MNFLLRSSRSYYQRGKEKPRRLKNEPKRWDHHSCDPHAAVLRLANPLSERASAEPTKRLATCSGLPLVGFVSRGPAPPPSELARRRAWLMDSVTRIVKAVHLFGSSKA